MIKQLLNSVIAKYRDLSVSRWSIISSIDLLTTDKKRYFAKPRPIIVNYSLMICFQRRLYLNHSLNGLGKKRENVHWEKYQWMYCIKVKEHFDVRFMTRHPYLANRSSICSRHVAFLRAHIGTILSPRLLYYSSLRDKRYLAMWMWLFRVKLKLKIAHFWLPSASQKRACLSSFNIFSEYQLCSHFQW